MMMVMMTMSDAHGSSTSPPHRRRRPRIWLVWKLIALCTAILVAAAAWIAYRPIKPPEDYRGQALRLMDSPQTPEERAAVEAVRQQLVDLNARLQRIIDEVEIRHGRTNAARSGSISSPSVLYGDPRGDENKPEAAIEVLLAAVDDGFFTDTAGFVNEKWSLPLIDAWQSLWNQLGGDYAIFGQTRSLAWQLAARMRLAAAQNDHETLAKSFDTLLALGRSTADGGHQMPYLVGMSLVGNALEAAQDALTLSPMDRATAAAMLDSLDRHLPLRDVMLAIEADRLAMLAEVYRQLQEQPPADRLRDFARMEGGPRSLLPVFNQRTRSLTERDLSVGELRALNEQYNDVKSSSLDVSLDSALRIMPVMFVRTSLNSLTFRSEVAATRILLAIEIYMHDSGGTPPASLDDLVPGILPEVPRDPIAPDGRFRYRLIDQSRDPHGRLFLLYTVGMNGVDNDGVENPDVERIDACKWREDDAQQYDAVFNRPSRVKPEVVEMLRSARPAAP